MDFNRVILSSLCDTFEDQAPIRGEIVQNLYKEVSDIMICSFRIVRI